MLLNVRKHRYTYVELKKQIQNKKEIHLNEKGFFYRLGICTTPSNKVWQKWMQNLFNQNTILLRSIPDLYFPKFLTHIWCHKSYTKQGSKVKRVNIIIR